MNAKELTEYELVKCIISALDQISSFCIQKSYDELDFNENNRDEYIKKLSTLLNYINIDPKLINKIQNFDSSDVSKCDHLYDLIEGKYHNIINKMILDLDFESNYNIMDLTMQ